MYETLKNELKTFLGPNGGRACINPQRLALTEKHKKDMETYVAANPHASVYELRRKIYEITAADFCPMLFPHSPFYAEMGGNGGWNFSNTGRWLLNHNREWIQNYTPEVWKNFSGQGGQRFFLCCGPFFDEQHNSPPISNILKHGFKFYLERAEKTLPLCQTDVEKDFVKTSIAGLQAVKVILEKISVEAQKRFETALSSEEKKNMKRIADTAARVPWNPPQTFYEGLCTHWFVREIMGEMDGLMVNSLGRPDAWLFDLYQNDLENKRISPDEAYDLVCRFLLQGDMMYDHDVTVVGYGDQENECVFTLGGCDSDGNPVFNDITRMFLKAHRELECIYPKPHCRYSLSSPQEYLKLITADIMSGRGVYSLVNDDGIIPALVKDGKSLEDARDYCCTGCWDIAIDSREDNSGGNYFSLARVLEATLYDDDAKLAEIGLNFKRLDNAKNFETFYRNLMDNTLQVLRGMLVSEQNGILWSKASPGPLNSACSSDCLDKRLDFTAGGQRYNPHAISLCFFGTFLDSMLAVDELCFKKKLCTVPELLNVVRNNWNDAENLRKAVLAAPHWGDAKPETVALANRIFNELYDNSRDIKNARGGAYQIGIWVYREFRFWGEKMRALPDGRCDGDELSQSLNPSHFRNDQGITTVLRCMSSLDFTKIAGNSVVNIVLDKTDLTLDVVVSLLRTFASLKLQLLQLNCSSREELLDAQKHPEAHQNLIVRLCGFSAKFTALSREWQNEVINRKEYGAL